MIRVILLIGMFILVKPLFAYDSFFFWHDNNRPRPIYGTSQLLYRINYLVNTETTAAVAVYIKSMRTGEDIYRRNIYNPFIPASTLKIFTAEAALIFLGSDFRFVTRLYTDAASINDGILQGNLYIELSGDPSLTYYDLADLMQLLQSQGVYAIKGNVYIDNTAYDQNYYGPGWEYEDKNYCYAAPISAGIINHNCYSFSVSPAKNVGAPAQIVTSNRYFYPLIHNSVVTVAAKKNKTNCAIRLATNADSSISVAGCMPNGPVAWGVSYVVSDVSAYDRALFKNLIQQFGIRIIGNVANGKKPANLTLVAEHASKPLHALINEMLKKSDNVIAGALFKKLGQLYNNRTATWENSSIAVAQILSKNMGLNLAGLRLLDGSGLSPSNLTTPAQMMQILDYAYHDYDTSYPFISSLPIAGVDGTLKHRMSNIAKRVRAKTGTISGVVTLSGYVLSADREPFAFVIMINGSKGYGNRYRGIEDAIATALSQFRRT